MKILRLKLRGFIGIKEGMGLDEIDLDLSGLSGLTALSGPNGNGKTTILENLHPYRCLASRNSSLKNHVFLRDSYRDLEFLFGGMHYRIKIKIDCDSDRSEAFLWEKDDPDIPWGNEHSVVDGKVSNYDPAIVARFGTRKLFFNSVFCPQDGKKLDKLTTGELRNLFAEFLRLYQYAAWEDTCKKSNTIIETQKEEAEKRIKELVQETGEKDRVLANINRAKVEIAAHERSAKYLREKLVETEAEHKEACEKTTRNAVLDEQISGHRNQIEAFRKAMADEKNRVDTELESQREQYRKLNGEMKELEATLAEKPQVEFAALREVQVRSELSDARHAFDEADRRLSAIQSQEKTLSEKIAAKEREKLEIDRDKAIDGMEKRIAQLQADSEAIDRELSGLVKDTEVWRLERELSSCKKQRGNLKGLIDAPHCRDKKCRFIADALESERNIPCIENQLAERRKKVSDKTMELTGNKKRIGEKTARLAAEKDKLVKAALEKVLSINSEIKKLSDAHDKLNRDIEAATEKRTRARKKIDGLETSLSQFKAKASELPRLALASSKIEGLKERLAEIEAEGKRARGRLDDFEKARLEDIARLEKRVASVEKQKDLEAAKKVEELKKRSDEQKAEAEQNEKEAAVLKERITSLGKELAEKERAEKKLGEMRNKKERLANEISEWLYLRDACGKTGLQALEIDGVAPGIAEYANELLEETFGPNSTIRFRTKDELTGKEVFEILIIDGETGKETPLEMKSGGQKVWYLMAIRLAMTLIAKQKSGKEHLTVMADELDGALDAENALSFISMYKAFMKAGKFPDCFFISHRQACVSMADNVLEFDRKGISIN